MEHGYQFQNLTCKHIGHNEDDPNATNNGALQGDEIAGNQVRTQPRGEEDIKRGTRFLHDRRHHRQGHSHENGGGLGKHLGTRVHKGGRSG